MRQHAALLVVVLFALGAVRGPRVQDAPGGTSIAHCPLCASHQAPAGTGHSPADPCSALCILCSACFVSNLTAPDAIWVRLTSAVRPRDLDWRAGRLTYPPPLPPPREQGC